MVHMFPHPQTIADLANQRHHDLARQASDERRRRVLKMRRRTAAIDPVTA